MAKSAKSVMYTRSELAIANVALKIDYDSKGEAINRMLMVDQMKDGIAINDKLEASTENRKQADGTMADELVDSEIEFTTTEKALLLSFMDRKWSVADAKSFLSLKEKLSA